MIGRPGMLAMLVLASLLSCGTTASAQSRHALVVGIDAYRNVAQLSRAVADARAMNATLQGLGFKTRLVENPDRNAMSVALAGFEESIEKGDTAFVFFAGHGIEIAGQNVLLPADVPDPGRASSGILRDSGLNTATLIERITARGARSAFFVFDACRDNPYAQAGNTRAVGSSRGLARTKAPEGVFVLMSAELNQQALDSLNQPGNSNVDRNPNSVFTRVLLEEMARPGLSHIVLAKAVQTRVRDLARSVIMRRFRRSTIRHRRRGVAARWHAARIAGYGRHDPAAAVSVTAGCETRRPVLRYRCALVCAQILRKRPHLRWRVDPHWPAHAQGRVARPSIGCNALRHDRDRESERQRRGAVSLRRERPILRGAVA